VDKVERAVLDTPVEGVNLVIGTLRDQIGREPTLLVFLRHLGCRLSQEIVTDLQAVQQTNVSYPHTVYFFYGTVEQGQQYLAPRWPEASFIADTPRYFYRAFNVPRGSFREVFSPEVWACTVRATLKGNLGWKRMGDPWQLPGAVLVEGDRILWRYMARHAGDRPRWRDIMNHVPSFQTVPVPQAIVCK
jgi:hypothetical protein